MVSLQLITRRPFYLTNRKSYLASKTQLLVCCPDGRTCHKSHLVPREFGTWYLKIQEPCNVLGSCRTLMGNRTLWVERSNPTIHVFVRWRIRIIVGLKNSVIIVNSVIYWRMLVFNVWTPYDLWMSSCIKPRTWIIKVRQILRWKLTCQLSIFCDLFMFSENPIAAKFSWHFQYIVYNKERIATGPV